ncbi:hypothetical protein IFU25_22065 [Pantoea agglomerans]|uniref:hypothetical protein n=1 Tax=Enterobacter agglomerans TaxID=549 RepID=UPI00177D56F6|nr:hypothetical protein [Pantoea agglomerans]MBD8184350.1 hypothetical protein [Pantoea agglomerans]
MQLWPKDNTDGPAGREQPVLPHRSSPFACAFSTGRCLPVFSVSFMSLLIYLLCWGCFSGFLSLKVNGMNSLMAPSGSPSLPGRQPYCANRRGR